MRPYNHESENIEEATGIQTGAMQELLDKMEKAFTDGDAKRSQVVEQIEAVVSGAEPRLLALVIAYLVDELAECRLEKDVINSIGDLQLVGVVKIKGSPHSRPQEGAKHDD